MSVKTEQVRPSTCKNMRCPAQKITFSGEKVESMIVCSERGCKYTPVPQMRSQS